VTEKSIEKTEQFTKQRFGREIPQNHSVSITSMKTVLLKCSVLCLSCLGRTGNTNRENPQIILPQVKFSGEFFSLNAAFKTLQVDATVF